MILIMTDQPSKQQPASKIDKPSPESAFKTFSEWRELNKSGEDNQPSGDKEDTGSNQNTPQHK